MQICTYYQTAYGQRLRNWPERNGIMYSPDGKVCRQ